MWLCIRLGCVAVAQGGGGWVQGGQEGGGIWGQAGLGNRPGCGEVFRVLPSTDSIGTMQGTNWSLEEA